MKPLCRFRVHPENKSLYFTVIVWPTLKALRKANPGNQRTIGLCKPYLRMRVYGRRDKRSNRLLPEMGEIHLPKGYLGVGIITHEICHAVIEWANRKKLDTNFQGVKDGQFEYVPQDSAEEQFCLALGEMVRQCTVKLYQFKLLR